MKKPMHFIVIVCSLFLAQTISAQTKKKGVATKQQVVKERITFIEKVLDNDIDAAAILIDGVFGAQGITFTGVEDSKDYVYDQNFKKMDTVYNYFRTLLTDAKFSIYLVANREKKVTEFRIRGYDLGEDLIKKIIQTTGISNWTILETKGKYTLYKKGKYFSTNIVEDYIDFQAFVPEILKFNDDVTTFSVQSSFKETIDYAQQLLSKMGYNLLVSKKCSVYNDENYKFISYNQKLIYSQGTEVSIGEYENKKISISISNPNAIVFASLKSKLLDEQWKEKYTNTIENCVYYRKNNLMVSVDLTIKHIQLYPVPDLNDYETQLSYGDFLTLYEMNHIYNGFDYDDRIAYMKDHFALDKFYNQPSFVIKKNGYNTRYLFFDAKTFETNWGLKFFVESDDKTINSYYTNGIEDLSLFSENVITNFKNNVMSNRIQFYDKAIYDANKASKIAKDNAQLLANQRQEAQQKQLEIERQQEKIKRNAELTDVINKTADQLMNMFKKN